jgi:serine/threonine-protein kinase ATR
MSEFEPPPSTIAAQLINNLSFTAPSRRVSTQDELKALMLEVSSTENSLVDFASPAARISHKHKLIYVFARSVLERLASDDPFLDIPMVVSQAFEALDVFIGIIKEVPDVLAFCLAEREHMKGRGREPLWIWLFPRILALLGRKGCEGLGEKIKDFFYVSFQAVSRSPKLWNLTSFFFRYLKGCATGMLP